MSGERQGPKSPQELMDHIESELLEQGLIPLSVEIRKGCEAHFWPKRRELWVVEGLMRTPLPYFDPEGLTNETLAKKVRIYLLFA